MQNVLIYLLHTEQSRFKADGLVALHMGIGLDRLDVMLVETLPI